MIDVALIASFQDERTRRWHFALPSFASGTKGFMDAVEQQHYSNFELWHEEDKARREDANDQQIAAVKRKIDQMNQRRNDLMERCDRLALEKLAEAGLPRAEASLHSESLGLMIDRLSILSLKIYHTQEEIGREDAPIGHAERNRLRLSILEEQRGDLASALNALWGEILSGQKRFKVYRQLKMYNEPSLNPELYGRTRS